MIEIPDALSFMFCANISAMTTNAIGPRPIAFANTKRHKTMTGRFLNIPFCSPKSSNEKNSPISPEQKAINEDENRRRYLRPSLSTTNEDTIDPMTLHNPIKTAAKSESKLIFVA